jgi:amino acid transporter
MGVDTPGLKRSIGLRTVVSTSAGLTFASSTFLVVVQVACYLAGDSAWIAILVAGALCALAAAAFSELNGMWPSVNGIRLYIHRAFGEKISLVAALTYMTVVTFVVGTEAYVLSHVLTAAVPAIAPPWWIFLMLTVATAVNFRGLKVAGAFQDVITYSVIASIVTMSILALAHVHFQIPHPLATGGIGPIFQAVGVAIFLFVGFEWVTPLADEVRSPKAIPVGMFIALCILVISYSLVTMAMFATFDGRAGHAALFGTAANRYPIPHIRFAATVFGPVGRWVMIVTSLCMSLTTFNAGLIGVSRFVYGMARDNVLPKSLANISFKFNTPDKATLLVYVIALAVSAVVYITQRFVMLVNLAAATESFIYAFAAASVVALRLKDRERGRPYRMWGGVVLPAVTSVLFAIIGFGVFAQPGLENWGSGIILMIVAVGWWIYIQFFAIPRIARAREAAAAKRTSRRPKPPPI